METEAGLFWEALKWETKESNMAEDLLCQKILKLCCCNEASSSVFDCLSDGPSSPSSSVILCQSTPLMDWGAVFPSSASSFAAEEEDLPATPLSF